MVTVNPNEWKNGREPATRSLCVDAENLRDGFNVGDHVVMREHDALWHSGAAAREDDGRRGIGTATATIQHRNGANRAVSKALNFCQRVARPRISSTKTAPAGASSFAFARKTFEVTTVRMPHCAIGGFHRFAAGGEIEIDGNASAQSETDIRESPGGAGGKQHADHLFGTAGAARPMRDHFGRGQRAAIS